MAENPNTPAEILEKLAADSEWGVRYMVAANPNTDPRVLSRLASDPTHYTRSRVAANPSAPTGTLETLAGDRSSVVRFAAATNPHTPVAVIEALAGDRDASVLEAVLRSGRLPRAHIEQIAGAGERGSIDARSLWTASPAERVEMLNAVAAPREAKRLAARLLATHGELSGDTEPPKLFELLDELDEQNLQGTHLMYYGWFDGDAGHAPERAMWVQPAGIPPPPQADDLVGWVFAVISPNGRYVSDELARIIEGSGPNWFWERVGWGRNGPGVWLRLERADRAGCDRVHSGASQQTPPGWQTVTADELGQLLRKLADRTGGWWTTEQVETSAYAHEIDPADLAWPDGAAWCRQATCVLAQPHVAHTDASRLLTALRHRHNPELRSQVGELHPK